MICDSRNYVILKNLSIVIEIKNIIEMLYKKCHGYKSRKSKAHWLFIVQSTILKMLVACTYKEAMRCGVAKRSTLPVFLRTYLKKDDHFIAHSDFIKFAMSLIVLHLFFTRMKYAASIK